MAPKHSGGFHDNDIVEGLSSLTISAKEGGYGYHDPRFFAPLPLSPCTKLNFRHVNMEGFVTWQRSNGHRELRPCDGEKLLCMREYLNRPKSLVCAIHKDIKVEITLTGQVTVTTNAPDVDKAAIHKLFNNRKSKGFISWLAGVNGWVLDPDQPSWTPFVDAFNKLQSVFLCFAPDCLKYMSAKSTKYQWTKQSTLVDAVFQIRRLLEEFRHYDENEAQHEILFDPKSECAKFRWRQIIKTVKLLMRVSNSGPNACVQWSAHSPRNTYPLSFVTSDTMTVLVNGLLLILKNLFQLQSPTKSLEKVGTRWFARLEFSYFKKTATLPGFGTPEDFEKTLNNGSMRNKPFANQNIEQNGNLTPLI